MPQGTVKWFNPMKGYGFIQPQEGGKDVFVHISAVERAGLSTLNEGQTVQYELVENRGEQEREVNELIAPRYMGERLGSRRWEAIKGSDRIGIRMRIDKVHTRGF